MPPVVSLDLLPADVPAEHAPAMVAACSGALAAGTCAMSETLPESARPDAVALVIWQGAPYLQVTVRVGRGDGRWLQRGLTFSERDSLSDRFTTVGLTVATLVGETQGQPPATPEPSPSSTREPANAVPPNPPQTPRERPRQPVSQPSRWLRVDVAALTGPSWDGGSWQIGGFLSVAVRPRHLPIVIYGFGSYAESRGPRHDGVRLESHWLTGGAGAGVEATLERLSLSGMAGLELAVRRVSVERGREVETDAEVPIRLRATFAFPARTHWAFVGGGALRLPPGSSERSDGERLRGPAIAMEWLAGLQVRL